MEEKQGRRHTNHVIIVTSDAVDANVRQFKIRTWILGVVIILLFAIFGALLGYLFYEERIWATAIDKSNQQLQKMEALANENEQVKAKMEEKELELTEEIQNLQDEIVVLSTTLNQTVDHEKELMDELEGLCVPNGFPLNGSASSIEVTEGENPMAKIVTSEGVMVVATAKGTVIAVNDDVDFGHNVWIDHGNGYVTIYRNQNEPTVKLGDEVYQGTTLFLISGDGITVGYQVLINGEYADPLAVMEIKG